MMMTIWATCFSSYMYVLFYQAKPKTNSGSLMGLRYNFGLACSRKRVEVICSVKRALAPACGGCKPALLQIHRRSLENLLLCYSLNQVTEN